MKNAFLILMIAGLPALATAQYTQHTRIEPVSRDTSEGFGMVDFSGYDLSPRLIDVRQTDMQGRTVAMLPTSMRTEENAPQRIFDAGRYYRIAELPIGNDEVLFVSNGNGFYQQVVKNPFDFTLEKGQTVYFKVLKVASLLK